MAENNQLTAEDEIHRYLHAEPRETALEFIAYLRKTQLTPQMWYGPGFWIIPWEKYNLFGIHLYGAQANPQKDGWVLWFFSGDYSGTADEDLIKLVQSNAGRCVKCCGECESQGVDMTIFGREYTNLCYQFPVRFDNPDTKALEEIKKLIELWKEIAPRSNGLHVR